jgi:hypothetical protein
MPDTAVTANFHQTFNIHLHFTPQITLGFKVFVDVIP